MKFLTFTRQTEICEAYVDIDNVRSFLLCGRLNEPHYGSYNNNNNNNEICIAQVCRMTSEALDGQLQSCYTARARPKCLTEEKCF